MNAAMQAVGTTIEYEPPRDLAEFLSLALAMEREAAPRYSELADAMEMANNVDVAELFRRMANIETAHVRAIIVQMRGSGCAAPRAGSPLGTGDGPETPGEDAVHYLMQPYHALTIALACEERAERFYERLVATAEVESVRDAARAMQAEEREHVALIRAWMAKVEQPVEGWADDPDPPRYTD